MAGWSEPARKVIDRCKRLAQCTEEPGHVTRTFLSPPMREVHSLVREWMRQAGLSVSVDAAGNIRGQRTTGTAPFYIGSHLDTVPRAGMYDGILGVMMGIALAEHTNATLPLEIIGFSEEEGVRFGKPFIGSRAFTGDWPVEFASIEDANGISIESALRSFGLDPAEIPQARFDTRTPGYLEFHIEQGPVLESNHRPLAIVNSIVGQSRLLFHFEGKANHAGTTPMNLRRDALAGVAEWIQSVESIAKETHGLVATVGTLDVKPGAGNVIPGVVLASLDVRHSSDAARLSAVERISNAAQNIAGRRGLRLDIDTLLDQPSVAMNPGLTFLLADAIAACGIPLEHLNSGAGHDAMVIAPKVPSAMLFLRSPGGISHHPEETVLVADVTLGLQAGEAFLSRLTAKGLL